MLLERTLADYAKQVEDRGEEFNLRHFFDQLNAIDSIPISLGHWELTGDDAFLHDYGAEIILSTACFWGDRAEYETTDDGYHASQ